MALRHLPVRPDLGQLKQQAKDLLRALRAGDPDALVELRELHPRAPAPADVALHDAQLVLARSYDAPSWPRLFRSCRLTVAGWRDDLEAVVDLVGRNPAHMHECALVRDSNWGPPLSYAANLGRDRIIAALHARGARDLEKALDRAALQGHVGTARLIHGLLGAPRPGDDALQGPAYTLSVAGTEMLFELGARAVDERGRRIAPVDVQRCIPTTSHRPADPS
jgi:hypothetical protein